MRDGRRRRHRYASFQGLQQCSKKWSVVDLCATARLPPRYRHSSKTLMRPLIRSDRLEALRIVRNAYRPSDSQASTYERHAMMSPMQSGVRRITKYSNQCCVPRNGRMRVCVSTESDWLQLVWCRGVAVHRVKPQQEDRELGGGRSAANAELSWFIEMDFASLVLELLHLSSPIRGGRRCCVPSITCRAPQTRYPVQ